MAFKEIAAADLQGKGNIGKPDTPGYSTAEMQRIMDEIPREVIVPAFNALVNALNGGGAAGNSGAQVPATLPDGTASTVQGVLDALAKQADDHIKNKENPHDVSAKQVKAEIPEELPKETAAQTQAILNALATYTREHKQDKSNPHSVTANQVGAYTKSQTDEAIDQKIVDIGSGDMAQAVYDPTGQRKDVFAAINTAITEALVTTMLRTTYDPQGKNTDVFAYTDEKSAAILKKVEQLTSANAGAHNAIYRGKFLGTSVTAAQYAAISAGTFDDLYIGDYWTIDGVNYRIAAFDYFLNSGDDGKVCTTHHVVVVPDTSLYNAQMHNTSSGGWESGAANTTAGGYVGSDMYKSNLEQAKTTIKNAFSGHVLKHRIYLTNAVANGRASDCAWCDSEVDLMCEQMVYGSGIFSPVSDGSNVPANRRVEKSQLPLFQHEPSRICNHNNWWLRDVITAFDFADVYFNGYADYANASDSRGVRPAFCIS